MFLMIRDEMVKVISNRLICGLPLGFIVEIAYKVCHGCTIQCVLYRDTGILYSPPVYFSVDALKKEYISQEFVIKVTELLNDEYNKDLKSAF